MRHASILEGTEDALPTMASLLEASPMRLSPYRSPASMPKRASAGGIEVRPEVAVFVALVFAGLILFFR
jgi:hypothetical protein